MLRFHFEQRGMKDLPWRGTQCPPWKKMNVFYFHSNVFDAMLSQTLSMKPLRAVMVCETRLISSGLCTLFLSCVF